MAKFKMKNGKGKVVEMKSIHDATTFRQNPEWVEVFDSVPIEQEFPDEEDGKAGEVVTATAVESAVAKQQHKGRPKKAKA